MRPHSNDGIHSKMMKRAFLMFAIALLTTMEALGHPELIDEDELNLAELKYSLIHRSPRDCPLHHEDVEETIRSVASANGLSPSRSDVFASPGRLILNVSVR